MRHCSRAILNCGGGGGADDGVFPNPIRRTPDHPPYSEMVSVALQALVEENGSTESSISAYIQSTFSDLPWGHDRLLPYYLRKLVVDGELTSPSPGRYQLSFHPPPSVSLPIRRRGRPRLYPPNPNPNVSRLPSATPRRRGRSQPSRRRGRPRKIQAEDMPPLHLEQGTPPLKRGRGRSRLRRGASISRTATQRLGSRLSSSSSKRRQDSFSVSNIEELNCQSGHSAIFNDINNGGSECVVLDDPEHIELGHAMLEQGQPFVALEQSDVGKGQILGEEPPLLILQPAAMPPFLAPEHCENVERQSLQGEELPFLAPEQTEFSQDQSMLGEKLPLLTPEQGKPLPFLALKLSEHDHGKSMQEAAPPFMPPEQTESVQAQSSPRERLPFFPKSGKVQPFLAPELSEHDHGQGEGPPFVAPQQMGQVRSSPSERSRILTLLPGKVPPLLAPEFLVHDQGQASQGEEPLFMSPEQIERIQKQSIQGPPLITSEEHEHDHGLPLASPEGSEDRHDQRLLGAGSAHLNGRELMLMPHPDEEEAEAENAPVSSNKRKSQGKRRSKRLWISCSPSISSL